MTEAPYETTPTESSETQVLRSVHFLNITDNRLMVLAFDYRMTKSDLIATLIKEALAAIKDGVQPMIPITAEGHPEDMVLRTVYLPENLDISLKVYGRELGLSPNALIRKLTEWRLAERAMLGERIYADKADKVDITETLVRELPSPRSLTSLDGGPA